MTPKPTPPGTKRAKTMGCTCSEPSKGGVQWIRHGCPLHATPKSKHFIQLEAEATS
jgi:hypothetical protein